MSDRIFVGDGTGATLVDVQETSLQNIRYRGFDVKRRVHPRLIIRKFRNISGLVNLTTSLEFHNFVLEEAIEDVEEKFQIVQTWGPDFLFLYGPKPRVFTYSGHLMNTFDAPWKSDWQRSWDRRTNFVVTAAPPTSNDIVNNPDQQRGILSGTNVILKGGIARLEYDGSVLSNGLPSEAASIKANALAIREGYLIKFQTRVQGRNPNACPFSFSMFVTNTLDY